MESIDARKMQLEQWLGDTCQLLDKQVVPMLGDASFRRYFRVHTPKGSMVAMDAPPPQENVIPFIAIAKALYSLGINTPGIIEADIQHGFLLLTDFGDTTYLKALTAQNADDLYGHALDALSLLQDCKDVPGRMIPPFTQEFMWQEWAWHKEWFLGKLLDLKLDAETMQALDQCYQLLVTAAATQPQVFMHRDYHSANLMLLADGNVGVLDFQDAFIGPLTYDLASLLRDCYIDWPEERIKQWVSLYLQKLQLRGNFKNITEAEMLYWFDLMSMQRHLKALFTFARKHVRDHQSQYLQHVPRTLNYLIQTSSRYTELTPMHHYLRTVVQPAFNRVEVACAL